MKSSRRIFYLLPLFSCLFAGACLSIGTAARAQDDSNAPFTNTDNADIGAGNAADGPVRMARISYVKGNVTWRTDDNAEWSTGTINLPLRQGAQIWVTDGGRAEIQFDDGSLLRLGNNAIATLQTLYSDNDGEFTEIKLTDGLASLRLKHDHSIFQMDTPLVSVKATGPAKLRIGAGDGVEVGVRSGQATVEGAQGKATLQNGDYLDLIDDNSSYDIHPLPNPDNWEQWNTQRDVQLDEAEQGYREHHLPSDIALVAGDLDDYGSWRVDPTYGSVWCPRETVSTWRPYCYGRWTWVNPFGWTWVSDEPWGWAPYHYGTWISASYGWAWVPGPVHQPWCPGAVHFSEFEGRVAWCPLSPAEVRYPASLAIGFRGGNWAAYFSIGQAAVYYPGSSSFYVSRPFRNGYVNHGSFAHDITHINNYNSRPNAFSRYQNSAESFAANHNSYLNSHFVPVNAHNGKGITIASASAFGGRGAYEPATAASVALFERGRVTGAPAAGVTPLAGPAGVRPTRESITPGRTFVTGSQPSKTALDRPVYRTPVNSNIERSSGPMKTWNSGTAANRLNNRTARPLGQNAGGGITGSARGSSTGTGSGYPGRTPSDRTANPAGRISNERASAIPGRNGTGESSTSSGAISRRDTQHGGSAARDYGTPGASADRDAAQRARRSLGMGDDNSRTRSQSGGSETPRSSNYGDSRYGRSNSGASDSSGRARNYNGGQDTQRGPESGNTPSQSHQYRRDTESPSSGRTNPRYDPSGSGRSGGSGYSPHDSGSSGHSYGSGSSSRDSEYSRRSSGSGSSSRDSGSSGRSNNSGSSDRSRGSSSDSRDKDSGGGGSSPTSGRGRGH